MFAILNTEILEDKKQIRVLKQRRNFTRGYKFRPLSVLGMNAVEVTVYRWPGMTDKEERSRYGYAAAVLTAHNVRDVCFAEGVDCGCGATDGKMRIMTDCILKTDMAGKVAGKAAGRTYDTGVFFGGNLSYHREYALMDMCDSFRYVAAALTGYQRAEIYESMLMSRGISPLRFNGDETVRADAAVFCCSPQEEITLSDDCVAVFCTDSDKNVRYKKYAAEIDFSVSENKFGPIPEKYPANILISEALQQGKIRRDDVEIRAVTIKNK